MLLDYLANLSETPISALVDITFKNKGTENL